MLFRSAHGVGSCIMGAIDRPALTKLLALPEKMRLCCMVALGYPTHKSHLVEMQNGSVKYYLDETGDYCVPKRGMDEVLIKTVYHNIKAPLRGELSPKVTEGWLDGSYLPKDHPSPACAGAPLKGSLFSISL